MADDQTTTDREPAAETGSSQPPRSSQPPPSGQSPLGVASEQDDAFAERPEAFVGAAFAGGLALALLMRRLAR
jgi:hypothetical protein